MSRLIIRPSFDANRASNGLIFRVGSLVLVLLVTYIVGYQHAVSRAHVVNVCNSDWSACWYESAH